MNSFSRYMTILAVSLCVFMSALEMTVVVNAMPHIVSDLKGLDLYGWVLFVYLLASTIMIPLCGKLSLIYSSKKIYVLGLVVFLSGSLLSGFAHSMAQLILFRSLQGVGAGALQALSFAIGADSFPSPQERARIHSILGTVWAVAGLVGPYLGGQIVVHASWQWIFFINVPIGLFALVMVVVHYRQESFPPSRTKLHVLPAFLLSGGITCLLLAAESHKPCITFPLAILFWGLFAWAEHRNTETTLPYRLFLPPMMRASILLAALMGALLMSTLSYLPLFAQMVLGVRVSEAGRILTPLLLGWPLANSGAGWLVNRMGYRMPVFLGSVLLSFCAVVLAGLIGKGTAVSLSILYAILFFLGVGIGMTNTAVSIVVQNQAPASYRSIALSSLTFARCIGGAVSVGGLGVVLALVLRKHLSVEWIDKIMDPLQQAQLSRAQLIPLARAVTMASRWVFVGIAVLAVMAVVIGAWFPKKRELG